MSEKVVDALRAVYEAWAGGNFRSSAGAGLYDPDLLWVLSDEFLDPRGYRGLEEAARSFREWLQAWSRWSIAAESFLEHRDTPWSR